MKTIYSTKQAQAVFSIDGVQICSFPASLNKNVPSIDDAEMICGIDEIIDTPKAFRKMHLISGGKGFATKSACGASLMRIPTATNFEGFKATPKHERCEKCESSKYYALMSRK
jgi:hypothetical protein